MSIIRPNPQADARCWELRGNNLRAGGLRRLVDIILSKSNTLFLPDEKRYCRAGRGNGSVHQRPDSGDTNEMHQPLVAMCLTKFGACSAHELDGRPMIWSKSHGSKPYSTSVRRQS